MSKMVEYQVNTVKDYKLMPGFWVNVKTNLQVAEGDSIVSVKPDHNLCVIKPFVVMSTKVDDDGTVNVLVYNLSRTESMILESEVFGTVVVLGN